MPKGGIPEGVTAAVEARNVTKIFGSGVASVTALDEVSVSIRQNEFFTLLGPSGCGKTTLLRLIAGFELPTSGSILLEGVEVGHLPPFKRQVNTVFQSYALFPHMTVAQNIGFGLEMLGRPKAEIAAKVDAMLRLVRMEELTSRRITEISGGQQQRVALARALAPQPKVLLLDEPLSALDFKLRKDMQIELKRLQHETGITFIFVTHDQEEALTMSDRIAVMARGRIRQIGTPRQIYDHPAERFVANFIGDTNFLEGEIIGVRGGRAEVRLAAGARLSAQLPEGARQLDKVTVVIRPEQARISSDPATATLKGTLQNVVYFGTDTHYYVLLDNAVEFIVRQQSRRDMADGFSAGQPIGIVIGEDAAQVLWD